MYRTIPILLAIMMLASVSSVFSQVVRPPVTGADYSEVRAVVQGVTVERCPQVRVTMRVTQSTNPRILDLRGTTPVITANNFFWRTVGRINPCDPRNTGAMAALYLLPGDEIRAKVFSSQTRAGAQPMWHIYGIARVASPPPLGAIGGVSVIDGLQLTLDVGRTSYNTGESVPLTLTLTNVGTGVRRLDFATGQQHDFVITRAGAEVWRWSRDMAFTQALTSISLRPGQSQSFTATWDQKDNQGRQVAPGQYSVLGELPTRGTPRPTVGPVAITIVERR